MRNLCWKMQQNFPALTPQIIPVVQLCLVVPGAAGLFLVGSWVWRAFTIPKLTQISSPVRSRRRDNLTLYTEQFWSDCISAWCCDQQQQQRQTGNLQVLIVTASVGASFHLYDACSHHASQTHLHALHHSKVVTCMNSHCSTVGNMLNFFRQTTACIGL